jgi:hypothetical protein
MIEPTGLDDSSTQMETTMKANGLMIRLMDLVCTNISMERSMKVIGSLISNLDMALRLGLMDRSSSEPTSME